MKSLYFISVVSFTVVNELDRDFEMVQFKHTEIACLKIAD